MRRVSDQVPVLPAGGEKKGVRAEARRWCGSGVVARALSFPRVRGRTAGSGVGRGRKKGFSRKAAKAQRGIARNGLCSFHPQRRGLRSIRTTFASSRLCVTILLPAAPGLPLTCVAPSPISASHHSIREMTCRRAAGRSYWVLRYHSPEPPHVMRAAFVRFAASRPGVPGHEFTADPISLRAK